MVVLESSSSVSVSELSDTVMPRVSSSVMVMVADVTLMVPAAPDMVMVSSPSSRSSPTGVTK